MIHKYTHTQPSTYTARWCRIYILWKWIGESVLLAGEYIEFYVIHTFILYVVVPVNSSHTLSSLSEPVLLNVYGAPELIPNSKFRTKGGGVHTRRAVR
jgi:hypothetical protein